MVYQSVDRGGGCPDLSEPQTFKNVSLQMTVYRAYTFRHKFYKKLYPIQGLDVRYEWPEWKRKRYPFTASTKICRFHRFHFELPLPRPWFCTDNFYATFY